MKRRYRKWKYQILSHPVICRIRYKLRNFPLTDNMTNSEMNKAERLRDEKKGE